MFSHTSMSSYDSEGCSESCRATHVNVYIHADKPRMQNTYRLFFSNKSATCKDIAYTSPFLIFPFALLQNFSYTPNFKLINAVLFFLEVNFWTDTLNLSVQEQNDALYLCAVLDALRHVWFSVCPMRLNVYGPVTY